MTPNFFMWRLFFIIIFLKAPRPKGYFIAMGRRTSNLTDMDSPIYRDSIHSLPFYCGIIAILVSCGMYGVVYLVDGILPPALTIQDERTNPDAFIAERAMRTLKKLTDMGPKVTGSNINEIDVVNYLNEEINKIISGANENQLIESDIQTVTGAYVLEAMSSSAINAYHNVQNVVVKLHSQNESESSLLINVHFDSVPTSPGASDDGINVAAILEVLRVLSKSNERPRHNVIFLFNGAEETPLQAAHGFISQHRWAKGCKVLINLEASGSGGKIILFQTGPRAPWLLDHYAKVPHPYGQAAGEEIFQSGAIPSDTDFRIFRDFGGLVGVDMAFFKDGYRYHTKYDSFDSIPLGSYQHVGDNTLSLVKSLANSLELASPTSAKGKVTYFDIFGLYMVYYSQTTAFIINVISILLSFGIFVYSLKCFQMGTQKSTLKYLVITLAVILGSWIVAGIFVFTLAKVLDLAGKTMSWYGSPWLIFGLYVVPIIGFSGCFLFLFDNENLSLSIMCQIQAHLVRLIWTLILLVGTYFSIRSVYALMIPVLCSSLGFLLVHIFRWQYSIRAWRYVYIISLIIPSSLLMYQTLTTFATFIPIAGRIGSDKNPELIIGAIAFFFTVLITSPVVALTNSLRKSRYYFLTLGLIFMVFLLIVFTPLGFPYSGRNKAPTPQRQWILHTERRFHNEQGVVEKTDAGFFFLNMDKNSPSILKNHVKELNNAISVTKDCDKYLLCGLPLSHAKMMQIMQFSTWVPSSAPILAEPLDLKVTSKTILSPKLLRYNLTTSGPDRLAFFLSPKQHVNLSSISLVENFNESNILFKERPLYFILSQYGKDKEDVSFTVDVQVPENWTGPTMDLVVTARWVHEDTMNRTSAFVGLINQIPEWADVTAWVSAYYAYVI